MTKNVKKTCAVLTASVLLIGIMLAGSFLMTETVEARSKNGPGRKGGTLYFYKNGKIAKAKKERRLKYKGNYYYVLKSGKIRRGWNVVGKHLYYFGGKNAAMTRSKVVQGITLLPDGKAEMSKKNSKGKKLVSLDAEIRYLCIKALKKRGANNMSKKSKLRAAWTYLTDRKTFEYGKKYPKYFGKHWQKKYAVYMLKKHRGNCYGFACTFAAFAYTIGYDPYVAEGRCRGQRDGAADGFTRHCVTTINGKYYDPEYWAIYRAHYLYGAKKTSYTFKDRKKPVRFKKVKGTIAPSVKKVAGKVKRIGDEYYLMSSSGKPKSGVWYVKGKLYNFNKDGKYGKCTTAPEIKKLNKAAKRGKPFPKLVELIGEAEDVSDDCTDEYDRTFFYKHITVSVKDKGEKGVIIIEIGDIDEDD